MSFPQTALARYTEDEYLAIERESEERYQYLDGEILLMAGESPQHADVSTNLTGVFWSLLKGTPCRLWSKDTKVRSGRLPKRGHSIKGLYSYPDGIIVCGEPQFLDEHQDVLINPKVIIEVLSPTTEAFDCNEKFRRYRTFNPSLTDYLLVAQDKPVIQHFAKRDDGLWVIAASVTDLSGNVHIASVNCTLQLAEVYDRIIFPDPEFEFE